ncbi:MAG: DUF6525 family protein [Pseudomonadota bacterium]
MTSGFGQNTRGQASQSAPARKTRRNLGQTSLKRKPRARDPMREFDGLPRELRAWVAAAELPWRPGSVRKSYERALAETGNVAGALQELDRLQERLIAKDAKKVWGEVHPRASGA